MEKKRYTLEDLSELKIEKEEITVEDKETGKWPLQSSISEDVQCDTCWMVYVACWNV